MFSWKIIFSAEGMRLEGENRRFSSSKAQVSLEIMTYIIILTLMLTIVSYAAVSRGQSILTEKINMDARRVAKLIAIEIDTAISVGDGYKNTFYIPQYLYNTKNYTLTVLPEYQRIYVDCDNSSYSVPLLTSNITGTVKKGNNIIKNENGLIKIE
ncbi:MAG: hypothetical protein NT129_02135 [Candidatus Aenigmarchaeota archaeon]|jgi:hypothetical protein|nr:hypothetical protein [Candidatus Aenigmarchaeota archaeon]